MLVLLGPTFRGTDDEYAELARVTGMVPYDLKMKCKPQSWGVVRSLADEQQARGLCMRLRELGLPACLVDSGVGHDPERAIVHVRRIGLGGADMLLQLRERSMSIPLAALAALVRGEVQVGRTAVLAGSMSVSSAAFRAVNPSPADVAVFREQTAATELEAFAALDLHFLTVRWVARVDARHFEFDPAFISESPAQDLEHLADVLAEQASVRVDRHLRVSSVASYTGRHAKTGAAATAVPRSGRDSDEHFDAYSRLVGEAERQLRMLSVR
ncbi:MAG TPA: hypothetical protein VI072_19735 [Polyangiaceae bacterium]